MFSFEADKEKGAYIVPLGVTLTELVIDGFDFASLADRTNNRGVVSVLGGGGDGGQGLDSRDHLHHKRNHSNPDASHAQS